MGAPVSNKIATRGRNPPQWRSKSCLHSQGTTCGLCGGVFPTNSSARPKGQKYHKCGTMNHFAQVYCNIKTELQVRTKQEETNEQEPECTFFQGTVSARDVKRQHLKVEIGGMEIEAMVDTGSCVNILTEKDDVRY